MILQKITAYEPKYFNYALCLIGLAIVWLSTHNYLAVLGAIIASLHIRFRFGSVTDLVDHVKHRAHLDGFSIKG